MTPRRAIALCKEERGTSTAEFVVLLVCIAVAAIAAWQFMGKVIVSVISGDDPHTVEDEGK